MQTIWHWIQTLPWLFALSLFMLILVIVIWMLMHDRTLRRRNMRDRRQSSADAEFPIIDSDKNKVYQERRSGEDRRNNKNTKN